MSTQKTPRSRSLLCALESFDKKRLAQTKKSEPKDAGAKPESDGETNFLMSISNFKMSSLRKTAQRRSSAPATLATPTKKGGSLMDAISGFDRSKLKSAKQKQPAHKPPRKSGGAGGLMGAISEFDRSRLKSAKKERPVKRRLERAVALARLWMPWQDSTGPS